MTLQTVFASSLFSLAALSAYSEVTESFNQTYPLSAAGSVSLQNVNGRIEVLGWDRDEVAVEAVKSADEPEKLEQTRIEIEAKSDALVITTRYEKTGWWRFWNTNNTEVSYRLRVPQRLAVTRIHGVNSSITVTGLKGRLFLETVNGGIFTTGSTDIIEAKTVNGSAKLAFASLPSSGKISVHSVNGSCQVQVPENSVYHVDAKTVNGSVNCEPSRKNTDTTVESAAVPITGPLLSLRTVNGSVKVSAR